MDIDRPVLQRAKQRFAGAQVAWTHGDILEASERLGSFDAVVSNATLHHPPDTRVALRCMRERVRPGGRLALVAFARPGWRGLPWALASLVARGIAIRPRGTWEHSASLLPLGRVFIRWSAPG